MAETDKEILDSLLHALDNIEDEMSAMFGITTYRSPVGFSQAEIYKYCGREDRVVTITLKPETESFRDFGDMITVSIEYLKAERDLLEKDVNALNDELKVRVRNLLPRYDKDKAGVLLSEGINTKDIIKMDVAPLLHPENTYSSLENRKPHILKVEFSGNGNGEDIGWVYGALKRNKQRGIALTPDEEAEYLAYKIIFEKELLTKEERIAVFDDKGAIHNNQVALVFLMWKQEARLIKPEELKKLKELKHIRLSERIEKINSILKGAGGILKFARKYPTEAKLLLDRCLRFNDVRFNVVGKHLLYMDFDSFLHIYLRHVRELTIKGLYDDKTKFQLDFEDVDVAIGQVMHSLNGEYQEFKDLNPEKKFKKTGEYAYYYNGDYYAIDVDKDGRLLTFYKIGEGKKRIGEDRS